MAIRVNERRTCAIQKFAMFLRGGEETGKCAPRRRTCQKTEIVKCRTRTEKAVLGQKQTCAAEGNAILCQFGKVQNLAARQERRAAKRFFGVEEGDTFLCGGECSIIRRIGGELGCCMYLCVSEYDELATPMQPLVYKLRAIRDNM